MDQDVINATTEETEDQEVEEQEIDDSTEETEETSDDILEAAQLEFRQRLESMGGKFDDKGEFLGFEDRSTPQNTPPVNQEPAKPVQQTPDLAKLRQEIMQEVQPTVTSGLIEDIVKTNPKMEKYKPMVQSALQNGKFERVDKSVVESLFYWARGQGVDVELAEATKSTRSKEKIDAGGSVLTDKPTGGVNKQTPKIDEKVAEYATAWGVDPKIMATKLKALKEKK